MKDFKPPNSKVKNRECKAEETHKRSKLKYFKAA